VDYFQGVVVDYLRADRAVFVNTECCIQINPGTNPDSSGPHWYCDAVAIDLRQSTVFLCEITYSLSLGALTKRLQDWNTHWDAVCNALVRDCRLPAAWPVKPWVFVPEQLADRLKKRMATIGQGGLRLLPEPLITELEDVLPWKYKSWNRCSESME
jgi:hypothetical protein